MRVRRDGDCALDVEIRQIGGDRGDFIGTERFIAESSRVWRMAGCRLWRLQFASLTPTTRSDLQPTVATVGFSAVAAAGTSSDIRLELSGKRPHNVQPPPEPGFHWQTACNCKLCGSGNSPMDGKSNGSSWDPLRVRAVGQERTFTEIPISGRLPPALLTDVRQEQTFTGD
jgi:hypothetical protein